MSFASVTVTPTRLYPSSPPSLRSPAPGVWTLGTDRLIDATRLDRRPFVAAVFFFCVLSLPSEFTEPLPNSLGLLGFITTPLRFDLLARFSGPGPGVVLTGSRHSDFSVRPSVHPTACPRVVLCCPPIRLYIQPVPAHFVFVFVFCHLLFLFVLDVPVYIYGNTAF